MGGFGAVLLDVETLAGVAVLEQVRPFAE